MHLTSKVFVCLLEGGSGSTRVRSLTLVVEQLLNIWQLRLIFLCNIHLILSIHQDNTFYISTNHNNADDKYKLGGDMKMLTYLYICLLHAQHRLALAKVWKV